MLGMGTHKRLFLVGKHKGDTKGKLRGGIRGLEDRNDAR